MASAIKTRKIKFGIVAGWDPTRPDPRGVRVTEKNYEALALWIGGNTSSQVLVNNKTKESEKKITILTDRGNRVRVARVGDVVMKINAEKFTVIKKDVFLGFES